MNVDEGILTNMDQLPITQLNYGGSEERFSWILYKVDYLKCSGKGQGVVYPSELYQNKLETIEAEIDGLSNRADDAENEIEILQDKTSKNKNDIISNDNDISTLKSRTTTLEAKANQNDYYFKYEARK